MPVCSFCVLMGIADADREQVFRLGGRLAALQLKLLLKRISARIPDIHPLGQPRYSAVDLIQALIDMPVRFMPERS